ncbi:uncharacterized protein [Battus philenor]|uniref:uncharacterized protein n=1 Tax=Battus philenor TaxID=42288 RepID=UPI0035CEF90D
MRVDSYIKKNFNLTVDTISKLYIFASFLIGINRLPLIIKVQGIYKLLLLGCSLLFNIILIFFVLMENPQNLTNIVMYFNLFLYFVCSIAAIISYKTLIKMYDALMEFDTELKTKYSIMFQFKSNFTHAVAKLFLIIVLYIVSYKIKCMKKLSILMLPVYFNNMIEPHYYGHLFNLFEIRLKAIRILFLSAYPSKNIFISSNEAYLINFGHKFNINLLNKNTKKVEVKNNNKRRFAKSLLKLTQARSLTFSVFRMVEINTSLPFKILELVVIYLVILLQFSKVVNFDHHD